MNKNSIYQSIEIQLENKIKSLSKDLGEQPIFDGIVNQEIYEKTSPKILWVLKEVNTKSEQDPFDMRKHLNSKIKTKNGIEKGWEKTFLKIIYVTNGILNNLDWNDDLKHPTPHPEVIDELKKIAYINIRKTSGGNSKSLEKNLKSHYQKSKHILLAQIKEFKPEIIIFGGTFKFFKNDVQLKHQMKSYGSCNALKEDGVVYIDAYHPQYFVIKSEQYFIDIKRALLNEL